MKNLPDRDYSENHFSKEQLGLIKKRIAELNRINRNDNLITLNLNEDNTLTFEIDDNDDVNYFDFDNYQKVNLFLDSRLEIANRFEQWKKDNPEEYSKCLKQQSDKKQINNWIALLNIYNTTDNKYASKFVDNGSIELKENDKTTTFPDFKAFNKWALKQLELMQIDSKDAIETIIQGFNEKNKAKNIMIDFITNRDGTIVMSFLNAKTKKIIKQDIKFKNYEEFISWGIKQDLL